jgi:hypothetical protein
VDEGTCTNDSGVISNNGMASLFHSKPSQARAASHGPFATGRSGAPEETSIIGWLPETNTPFCSLDSEPVPLLQITSMTRRLPASSPIIMATSGSRIM